MAKKSQVVYEQMLRWEPLAVPKSKGRAWIKTFNIDRETGARSAVIKYDRGFTAEAADSQHSADILVLEGEMTCAERHYNEGTYHYRPRGSKTGPISTETGCIRIVLSAHEGKGPEATEEVWIQDVNDLEWAPSYTNKGDIEKGCVKILREDSKAGVSVLISGAFKPDMVLDGRADVHDHFEEAYQYGGVIEDYFGDVDGHVIWGPGFYVYRQPFESAHGDVLKTVLPQLILVKRGWTGEAVNFYDTAWKTGQTERLQKPVYGE